MRFPSRSLAAVAAVALLTASCAVSTSVAAVNGEAIPGDDVLALRKSYQDDVVVGGEDFRADLTNVVFVEAQLQAAEEQFGLTGLDSPEAIADKLTDPAPVEQQILDTFRTDPDRTPATLELVAVQLNLREQVTEQLVLAAEGFLEDVYNEMPELAAIVCVRHILTASPEEAAAAAARVEAGEDFAAVAIEVSLDTQTPGGSLPCPSPAATYVPPFGTLAATAPLGEFTEPFQTEFGWHVIIVDDRIAPTSLADLEADPLAYLLPRAASELWTRWLDDTVAAADIEIRSQVGTWVPEADGILPPPSA